MTRMQTKVRVNADGNVIVPIGVADAGQEVLITVEPAMPGARMTRQEWLDFLDKTEGSIDDPTFVRHPQPTAPPPPSFE
jgi:hypothetical protein